MRRIRLAVTIATAGLALAALTTAVRASVNSHTPPASRLNQGSVDFTRIQTVTLIGSVPTATQLTTIWENTWRDVNLPYFTFPLPPDYSDLSIFGTHQLLTNQPVENTYFGEPYTNYLRITPTLGLPIHVSYHTDTRAVREGNLYRIQVRARNNGVTGIYTTSVFFGSDYEFVSAIDSLTDTLPLTLPVAGAGYVYWGSLAVGPVDALDRSITLGDTRLPVDLAFQSVITTVAPDRRSMIVTATVINSGTVETGNFFILELYDKPNGDPPPSGPNDHLGGACRDASCSTLRDTNVILHLPSVPPSQTVQMVFNYPFEVGGLRDIYLQVDTWGASNGYILEPSGGENNNLRFVGTVHAVGRLYLPILLRNK
jgi:hypothetical protein